MADVLKVANDTQVDELTAWAKMQTSTLDGSTEPQRIEDCLPDLAPRLRLVLHQALEQASKEFPGVSSVRPEILWAPHRVRVEVDGTSHETEIDDSLQSLEEALVSLAWGLAVGTTEY